MDAIALTKRLHQHRSWVNQKLLAACESLSDEDLRQPFHIGQGSVWKSLLHMYAAEFAWLEALLGDTDPLVPGDLPGELPGNQGGEGRIVSFADLTAKWADLSNRWGSYLARLTSESLDEMVQKRSTSSGLGRIRSTSRADVLLHVCIHAHYTAAQVVNMLRQMGVDSLPDVMLITLARQEAADQRVK